MPAITDILSSIYTVSKLIYEQVKLAQANKEQCATLNDRVEVVVTSVRSLALMNDKMQYEKGLRALETCLKKCSSFIAEHSKDKSWFKQVLKAGTASDKFAELNVELQNAVSLLNLNLNTTQLVNHEKDKTDQEQDHNYIIQKQDEIIRLNQMANTALHKIQMKQTEQHAIVLNQLASIKAQMLSVLETKITGKKPQIPSHLLVPYYEIEFNKLIGEGASGKVYHGKWQELDVAIKTLNVESKENLTSAELIREVQIMSQLHHTNVVQLNGVCLEPSRHCIVMEYMEQGTLESLLELKPLPLAQKQQLLLDISNGLSYLHSREVLHRDLKSVNILVNGEGKAKLADFGLSKSKSQSIQSIQKQSQGVAWQAPECFQLDNTYNAKCDVYSFGMVMWEIMTGKKPYLQFQGYGRDLRIIEHVKSGKREDIGKDIPEHYASLIRACLHPDPSKRPEMSVVTQKLKEAKNLSMTVMQSNSTGEEEYERGLDCEEEKDFDSAFQHYQAAYDKGYFKAPTNLAHYYLKGIIVKQSEQQAFQYTLESANKNHSRAMFNVAIMYEKGEGTKEDSLKALGWYDKVSKLTADEDQARAVMAKQRYKNLYEKVNRNNNYENNLASRR